MSSSKKTKEGKKYRSDNPQQAMTLHLSMLRCTVCSNAFTDPHLLVPCGHTFCSECIDNQKKTECPVCHQAYTSHASFYVLESLGNEIAKDPSTKEWLESASLSLDRSPICMNCDRSSQTNIGDNMVWCTDCHLRLCRDCSETIHAIKAFASHEVRDFKEAKREVHQLCSSHRNELKCLCDKCNIAVCRDCVYEQHSTHGCTLFTTVVSNDKERLKQITDKSESSPISLWTKAGSCNRATLERLSRDKIKARDAIDAFVKSIVDYCDQVKADVESSYDDARKQLKEYQLQVDVALANIEATSSLLQSREIEQIPSLIAPLSRAITTIIAERLRKPPPLPDIVERTPIIGKLDIKSYLYALPYRSFSTIDLQYLSVLPDSMDDHGTSVLHCPTDLVFSTSCSKNRTCFVTNLKTEETTSVNVPFSVQCGTMACGNNELFITESPSASGSSINYQRHSQYGSSQMVRYSLPSMTEVAHITMAPSEFMQYGNAAFKNDKLLKIGYNHNLMIFDVRKQKWKLTSIHCGPSLLVAHPDEDKPWVYVLNSSARTLSYLNLTSMTMTSVGTIDGWKAQVDKAYEGVVAISSSEGGPHPILVVSNPFLVFDPVSSQWSLRKWAPDASDESSRLIWDEARMRLYCIKARRRTLG